MVGAVVVYFQFVRSEYSKTTALKGEKLSLQSFFESEKAAVNRVRDLINSYKKENQQIQQTASLVLPSSPDIAGALAQLYGLSNLADLVFQDVSMSVSGLSNAPGASAKGLQPGNLEAALQQPIGTVSFNLRLTGSYDDFKMFLSKLQTNMRIFDVKTVTMNPVPKVAFPGARLESLPPGAERYDFSVVVSAYYQSQ